MTKLDWEININNLTDSVAEKYGIEAARTPFTRYGATCFDDLSPAYYSEVFGDLMLIDEDD
jgi:hypothetical protein